MLWTRWLDGIVWKELFDQTVSYHALRCEFKSITRQAILRAREPRLFVVGSLAGTLSESTSQIWLGKQTKKGRSKSESAIKLVNGAAKEHVFRKR
jgi:hypothetical protein